MIKLRECLVPHNPPYSYGDCIRACVATLADDDSLPHLFGSAQPSEAWAALKKHLKSKGKNLVLFPLDAQENPFDFMAENNENVPYMLLCETAAGGHAIIGYNDQILHDPAWNKGSAIKGPLPNMGCWILGVVA